MAIIIPFPKKEYELISRREYYIENITYKVCETIHNFNIDLDEHEEDLSDIYEIVSNIVNEHLGIYENRSEEFRSSDEEVQETF